jgi:hypothetical protein
MEVTEPATDELAMSASARHAPQIGGAVVFVWALEGMRKY